MVPAEFTAMALAAPTLQFRPQVLTQVTQLRALNLSMLRTMAVATLVENAPRVTSAPDRVERALAGADGTTYFVPQARISERSKATGAPNVFLAKSAGVVTLQVWFDLVLFPSLPTDSKPLPVDGYSVSLIPASGDPIVFARCDDLPRGDQPETVLSRLYCETPVDPNIIVPILETPGTRFLVQGDVHFTVQDGAAAAPADGIRVSPAGRLRVFDTPARAIRLPDVATMVAAAPRVRDHRVLASPIIRDHLVATDFMVDATPVAPEPAWASRTARLSLGAADNSGVAACFPRDVMNNRAIYSQVTSGFGAEPWSEWVDSPNGQFMDSPVPDQFYVVPDEYRLAFDQETKQPAMMVLLVPPKRVEGEATPATFGSDYKLRTRFSVVPWIDPARRERLRAEIARHARVAYPDLLVGGIREATCELSTVLHELGSSIVGTEGATAVDGLGFDLVLDCTSEFYNTLTHLLVTEGVEAQVKATLVSDAEHPRIATVPVKLRLDRPATDVLSATLVPPAPPAETAPDAASPGARPGEGAPAEGAPAEPAPVDGAPAEPLPVPVAMPAPAPSVLRVSNPLPYAVTVGRTVASLLERDADLPSPIGAVPATAEPSSFQLPAAVDGIPSTLDVVLTAEVGDQPKIFGSVGVSFEGITIDIDPQQVLAKAYDTGTTGSVSSAVEVRSYQLEHPETRPPELADVFGLEVEIRRSADAKPVTVFLTTDQPKLEVQVSFSLSDIVAGARPEQPTFEWRRRNMGGAGNGEWSEWSTITGRQLFVSPTGM
ncbi:hypothetical protein [Microbacterium sp. SS28]|uniref:hypothetical protein n=1 Tax=Microbacterium sp. SS28 TaxID=2919948 RepID=UPI001FAAC03E|nr:hypothetical protein [Microbacterium sp. SS28]